MGTLYYSDEFVTLYHGDALAIMSELPAESVDVVFTDPPYSSGARNAAAMRARGSMRREGGEFGKSEWIATDNLTSHGFAMLVRLFGVEALRVVRPDGHLFSFIDWRQLPVLQGAVEAAGWSPRALLVWDKMSFGMGNGFRQQAEFILHASKGTGDNFLEHDTPTVLRERRPSDVKHPTPKPLGVIGQCLRCVPGNVLDPFAGGGATLVAAKNLRRSAIGIENTEAHCETIAQRLSQDVLDFGGVA